MKRAAVLFVAALFALVLLGCVDPNAAPPPPTFRVTANTFCTVMKVTKLTWSVHDTNETIDGIRGMNHIEQCVCGKPRPKNCASKPTS